MAEKYQPLPGIAHMGVARLNYTASLLDTLAGAAFNRSAQFDACAKKSTAAVCRRHGAERPDAKALALWPAAHKANRNRMASGRIA